MKMRLGKSGGDSKADENKWEEAEYVSNDDKHETTGFPSAHTIFEES